MKGRIPAAVATTAVFVAGLFWLFPAPWAALLLALLGLLTAQAVLLRRHTTVLRGGGLRPARGGSAEAAAQAAMADLRPPEQSVAESAPPGPPTSELFSRFRTHLESMEKGAPPVTEAQAPVPTAVAPASTPHVDAPASVAAAESGDRVELSAAARAQKPPRQQGPASASAESALKAPTAGAAGTPGTPPPSFAANFAPVKPGSVRAAPGRAKVQVPPREDDEEDLFADLRPSLTVGPLAPAPGSARQAPGAESQAGIPGSSRSTQAGASDEVAQALERARAPEQIAEDGEALQRLAQEAHDNADLARLKAVLEQYDALLADAPDRATWQAARLHARLAVLEGRADDVGPAYQSMLERGYQPAEASVEAEIDALLEGLDRGRLPGIKAALLSRALAPFRQAGERAALDRLYLRIEAAAEAAGDERRLIQYYKNHLAIREALGDRAGRLDLIDKIGNRYYRLGDTAASREYYEMGLKLRAEAEAEKPESPSPEPAPAPEAAAGGGQGRR